MNTEPINGHDTKVAAAPSPQPGGWYLHNLDLPFPTEAKAAPFSGAIPGPAIFQRAYCYWKQESVLARGDGSTPPPVKTVRLVFLSLWEAKAVQREFVLVPGVIPIPWSDDAKPQLFECVVDSTTGNAWALWGPEEGVPMPETERVEDVPPSERPPL